MTAVMFKLFWLVMRLQIFMLHSPGRPIAFCLSKQFLTVAFPWLTVDVPSAVSSRILCSTTGCPVIESSTFVSQVFGLYKGMASPMYGLGLINAIVFGVQGNVLRRLPNPDSLWSVFTAGGIAGLAQCPICSPMELAKTRMQIQGQGESHANFKQTQHAYKGPVDCIIKIYRTEGVRGAFRGFTLTCVRELPSFGMYFASFEWLCKLLGPKDPSLDPGVAVHLVAGGVAGMCSWACTYPVDVMKSRIQADMTGQYKGFLDCCRQSVKESGMMVFTKGLGSTMLRAFPVNAATFGTVTYVMKFFKADQEDDDGTYNLSQCADKHDKHEQPVHLPVVRDSETPAPREHHI